MLPESVSYVVGTGEVGVDSVVPLFVVNLGERNGADATSAVDKNVDVAALLKNLSNGLLDALGICNVHCVEEVTLAELLDKLAASVLVTRANDYMSTSSNNTLGDLSANTSASACNQNQLTCKIECHALSFFNEHKPLGNKINSSHIHIICYRKIIFVSQILW